MKNCHRQARIEIYLSEELKTALQSIADRRGTTLSKLVVQTLIDALIHPLETPERNLEKFEKRILKALARIEEKILEKPSEIPLPVTPKRPVVAPFVQKSNAPVFDGNGTGEILTIEDLIVRFDKSGDRAIKARLILVGGKKLFQGNLEGALKVSETTSKIDPEGKSWLPLDEQRRQWIQMEPREWVKKILNSFQ